MDTDSLFRQALAHHQSGDIAAARDGYVQLLHAAPNNAAVLHVLGVACLQQGDLDEAEQRLRAAIALCDDRADYHSNLGLVLRQQGRFGEAIEAFRTSLELKPEFEDARINLGSAYLKAERLDDAEATFRRVLRSNPDRPEACNNLAVLRIRQGRHDEALDLLQHALDVRPDYTDALVSLGKLSFSTADFEQAGRLLQTARRQQPDNPDILKMLAHCQRFDEPETALRHARDAVKHAPDDAGCHVALGSVLQAMGRRTAAEKAYRDALGCDPRDADALNNLGTIFREQKQTLKALRLFREAVRVRDVFADGHYNLGTALLDVGDSEQAADAFERSLRIRPTPNLSYRCLVDIYHATDRSDRAIEVLDRWLQHEPDSPTARHRHAAFQTAAAPSRASDAYVREEFDQFASGFDATLARLEYCGPQKLMERLHEHRAGSFDSVLDAGCGTGLAAALLRPLSRVLHGVDLSPRMIERATERSCYDELFVEELVVFMNARPAAYDLVFSADTLIYFGDLGPVFCAMRRATIPGGNIVFSLEHHEDPVGDGFLLNASGRYSHTRTYVDEELRKADLKPIEIRAAVLRKELQRPVAGLTVLARAESAGPAPAGACDDR